MYWIASCLQFARTVKRQRERQLCWNMSQALFETDIKICGYSWNMCGRWQPACLWRPTIGLLLRPSPRSVPLCRKDDLECFATAYTCYAIIARYFFGSRHWFLAVFGPGDRPGQILRVLWDLDPVLPEPQCPLAVNGIPPLFVVSTMTFMLLCIWLESQQLITWNGSPERI